LPAAKNKSLSFQTVLFIWLSVRVPRRTAGYAKKKDLPYNAPQRGTKSPSSIDGSFSDFLHYSTFKAQKQPVFPAIIFYYFKISHTLND